MVQGINREPIGNQCRSALFEGFWVGYSRTRRRCCWLFCFFCWGFGRQGAVALYGPTTPCCEVGVPQRLAAIALCCVMVIVVAGCLFGLAPQTLFLKLKPSGDVCRLTVMLGYGCNLFVFCHGNIFMVSKLVGLRACLVGESSVFLLPYSWRVDAGGRM